MNERINKLAIKAGGIWRGGYVEQPNGDSVWTDRKFVVDVDTEQFAELIIRECAEIAFQFSMENKRIHPNIDPTTMPEANQSVYHSTCQAVGYEIREHFGVEE
jgi:hypothetical protein